MDLKKCGFENVEENMIYKIYHNDMEDLQNRNQSKEYVKITKKIEQMEKTFMH